MRWYTVAVAVCPAVKQKNLHQESGKLAVAQRGSVVQVSSRYERKTMQVAGFREEASNSPSGGEVMAKDTRKGDRHRDGYTQEFNQANYVQLNLRVRKDSGIAQAIDKVCERTGMSRNEYIRKCVVQDLVQCGYLPNRKSE